MSIVGIGGGGGSPAFTYKLVITALVIMIMMPIFATLYISQYEVESDYHDEIEQSLEDYYMFTGQKLTNKDCVWALTGIYTPYGYNNLGQPSTSTYGYTPDGWCYGAKVYSYSPSQYYGSSAPYTYTVSYNDSNGDEIDGFYHYASDTNDGHKAGDLYTSVSMSTSQRSNMFFTQNGRIDTDNGFYYTYTGYRYAFQPLNAQDIINEDGDVVPMTITTTSCSLIWYQYFDGATVGGENIGGSGIAGQLIISGSDGGVSYLTSQNIVQAFNTHNNSASFPLTFNGGVRMTLTIRIDPTQLNAGKSVQECYDQGYWSVMLTSKTTDASAYLSTDYAFNIANIWNTFVAIFTFNMSDYYNISDDAGMIMSVVVTIMLYAALLAIGLEHQIVLIIAGLVAVVQAVCTAATTWMGGDIATTMIDVMSNVLQFMIGVII